MAAYDEASEAIESLSRSTELDGAEFVCVVWNPRTGG